MIKCAYACVTDFNGLMYILQKSSDNALRWVKRKMYKLNMVFSFERKELEQHRK